MRRRSLLISLLITASAAAYSPRVVPHHGLHTVRRACDSDSLGHSHVCPEQEPATDRRPSQRLLQLRSSAPARASPARLSAAQAPSGSGRAGRILARARRFLTRVGRTALVSAAILLPIRLSSPSGSSFSLQREVIAAPALREASLLEEEYVDIRTLNSRELREELEQRGFSTSGSRKELISRLERALTLEEEAEARAVSSNGKKGGKIVVTLGKGVAGIVGVSVAGSAALSIYNRRQEEARLQTLKRMNTAKPIPKTEDAPLAPAMPKSAPAPQLNRPAPRAAAAPAVAPPAPAPAPPRPKPKGVIGNLFQKKAGANVPSIDELCAGPGARAELCKTLVWALRAPVDVASDSQRAPEAEAAGQQLDSESSLALDILERLDMALKATQGALGKDEVARCAEDVGRAMLLENVDAAAAALDDDAKFAEAALSLCRFVNNAGVVATELGVAEQIGEVLYEGSEPRRKLERIFSSALTLATPEFLSTMGMGDEEGAAGPTPGGKVDFDTVSLLAPLLKIRKQKAEQLMQDTMQRAMKSMMGGTNGEGIDLSSPGGMGGPSMEKAVDMLEEMVDSGAVGPEDLESLRGLLSKQMGMPVDEMLKRKDELMAELPAEGRRLFAVIDKLFGPNAKAGATKAKQVPMPPVDQIPDDPNAAVSIKPGAISAADAAATSSSSNDVKVNIRQKPPAPNGPAAPSSSVSADIKGVAKPMSTADFISSVNAGAKSDFSKPPPSERSRDEPPADAA